VHDLYNLLHCSLQGFCYILGIAKQLLFLVLSCTRVLLPLSLIVGFILILQGTPMGFDGKLEVQTMEAMMMEVRMTEVMMMEVQMIRKITVMIL